MGGEGGRHVTLLISALGQQHLSVLVHPEAMQVCQNADHRLPLTTGRERADAHSDGSEGEQYSSWAPHIPHEASMLPVGEVHQGDNLWVSWFDHVKYLIFDVLKADWLLVL